jgi:hypothetical protein
MSFHDLMGHRAGHDSAPPSRERAFPRSLVRVLQTEGELHEAVDEAIGFERDVAVRTAARVAQYEVLSRHRETVPHVSESHSSGGR